MERQERLPQESEAVADPVDTEICTEVTLLKALLAKVEAERDALRATPSRPQKVQRTDQKGLLVIPTMPNLVPGELKDLMKGRQADLQEALEFGEGDRVLENSLPGCRMEP